MLFTLSMSPPTVSFAVQLSSRFSVLKKLLQLALLYGFAGRLILGTMPNW